MQVRNALIAVVAAAVAVWPAANPTRADDTPGRADITRANETLAQAGANQGELERALRDAPVDQRASMLFLVANMPDRDATTLSADFLLKNVADARRPPRK